MKTESELISILEKFPHPVTLKTSDTGKYLFSNAANARMFNVEDPKELIGLTVRDLKYPQVEAGLQFSRQIEAFDFHVREHKTMIAQKQSRLVCDGVVFHEELVKFPLLGMAQQVVGVFTYARDLTGELTSTQLYGQYRGFYDKQDAIERVLDHLELREAFAVLPTETQLLVFLDKAEGRTEKEIAERFKVCPSRVAQHVEAMNKKLIGADLIQTLAMLKQSGSQAGYRAGGNTGRLPL